MLEKLIDYAKQKGMSFSYAVDIDLNKQLHYWYGNIVVVITDAKENDYLIVANGDVWAKFYSAPEIEEIYVRDKNNNASFKHELGSTIKSDDHLLALMEAHEKGNYPQLFIDSNNWFELFAEDAFFEGDMGVVLESDKVVDAIKEAIELINEETQKEQK